jgi:hypothetical protein
VEIVVPVVVIGSSGPGRLGLPSPGGEGTLLKIAAHCDDGPDNSPLRSNLPAIAAKLAGDPEH